MGKDPSAVVLATALAFCAFCPFFARCNDTGVNDIKNGIDSLSKVLVKYQAGFDRKVKFVQLQKAINEIDPMLGYMDKAKDKLRWIRSLNSDARLTYQNCVAPISEWCQSINATFDVFIDNIGDSHLSETDRNIIWDLTVYALEWGLEKTNKSLELLTNVQNRTAQLKNAFKEMKHDVHDDFGPGGFYSEEKVDLQKRINSHSVDSLGALFDAIGVLVFGPIGNSLGLTFAFAAFGITDLVHWQQIKPYQEQVELIDHFFTVLPQKIELATEKVKEMESDLEEDKTNLQKLRRAIAGSNEKGKLLSDMALRRVQLIPNIQNLKDSCAEYVKWLEYDTPFYQRISSRTRRSASTFYESEPSPA